MIEFLASKTWTKFLTWKKKKKKQCIVVIDVEAEMICQEFMAVVNALHELSLEVAQALESCLEVEPGRVFTMTWWRSKNVASPDIRKNILSFDSHVLDQ